MAFRKALISLAFALFFGVCTASPSPISVGDSSANATAGSYRAEVAALQLTHYLWTSEQDRNYHYDFITNEYAGDSLVRQCLCSTPSIALTELEGREIICQDVTSLDLEMVEGDYPPESFGKILLAKLFNANLRTQTARDLIDQETQTRSITPVMVIVVDSVTSDDEFGFHILSGPESERVNSTQINVLPREIQHTTGDVRRMGLLQVRKQIEPYQYFEE